GDASCQPGSVCVQGTCVPGCNMQHACPMGENCCTGQCYDGQSDPNHCGGCNPCPDPPSANAPPVCNNGVCRVRACSPGFGDCNGDPTDGCEADLMGKPGCPCVPGSQQDCYDGPPGTLGNGPCVGGKKTCDKDGVGYGPCVGEVLPQPETCMNLIDD